MRKLFPLAMILLFAAAGCLTSDDDSSNDNGAGGATSAAEYLPFKVGATFTFDNTNDSSWSEPYTYTSTMTIAGTTTINDKTYYIMVDDTGGWQDTTYARLQNGIMYEYGSEMVMAGKAAAFEAVKKTLAQALAGTDTGTEIPMFNFSANSWNIYSYNQSEGGFTINMTATGKYKGKEAVTVPAGAFTDCAKFEITITSQSSYNVGGQSGGNTWNSTMLIWFAKGVGPVKSSEVSSETNIGETEPSESTYLQVLTSYNIPD